MIKLASTSSKEYCPLEFLTVEEPCFILPLSGHTFKTLHPVYMSCFVPLHQWRCTFEFGRSGQRNSCPSPIHYQNSTVSHILLDYMFYHPWSLAEQLRAGRLQPYLKGSVFPTSALRTCHLSISVQPLPQEHYNWFCWRHILNRHLFKLCPHNMNVKCCGFLK